jgi:hypothetical protein
VDRRKNKIVAFRISKNDDKIDSAVCRRLLNDVIYNNNSNYKLKNKINVITTDGNWSYTRLIKCNYRKISSLKKSKTKNKNSK